MPRSPRFVVLLLPLLLGLGACTTLPDVKPFAETTAELSAAAGSHYHEVASEVAALKPVRLPGETTGDAGYRARKAQLEATQAVFRATDGQLDRLFAAMTAYSEKVASLAASGGRGAEAAQSLLDCAQGFVELAGGAGPPDPTLPILVGFKAIAAEFTRMQAKKSLQEAVAAAQPGVEQVAQQFAVIYGEAMRQASAGLRNSQRLHASLAAGPNIIGFRDNVQRNYNAYYRVLNGFVRDVDADAPAAAWRGFCRESRGPCQAARELDAVGLVEARMAAIAPITDAYDKDIAAIEAKLKHRRNTSKAVIRAVNAWALEHHKLQQSLQDGSPLSAFNLRAALLELDALLQHQPKGSPE